MSEALQTTRQVSGLSVSSPTVAKTAQGIAVGALGGALLGLIVGALAQNPGRGAGIGAAAGLVLGGIMGYSKGAAATVNVTAGAQNITAAIGSSKTFVPPSGAQNFTVSSTAGNPVSGQTVTFKSLPDDVMTMWTDTNGAGQAGNYTVQQG